MKKENKIHKTKSDRNGEYFDHKNNFKRDHSIKNFSILPHPATLESYETVAPGITDKLGHMIAKEQEFRHKLERLKTKGIYGMYRFGQLLSTILVIVILYATLFVYSEYNDQYLSSIICISGFTFLTIVNVVSFKDMTQIKNTAKNKNHQNKQKTFDSR